MNASLAFLKLKKVLAQGRLFLNRTSLKYKLYLQLKKTTFLEFLIDLFRSSFRFELKNLLKLQSRLLNFSLVYIFLENLLLKLKVNHLKCLRNLVKDFFIHQINYLLVLFNIHIFKNFLTSLGKQQLYFDLLFKAEIKYILLNFQVNAFYYNISTNKFFLAFLLLLGGINFLISALNLIFRSLSFLRWLLLWFFYFNKLKKN